MNQINTNGEHNVQGAIPVQRNGDVDIGKAHGQVSASVTVKAVTTTTRKHRTTKQGWERK